jgi:hypothetical protein
MDIPAGKTRQKGLYDPPYLSDQSGGTATQEGD